MDELRIGTTEREEAAKLLADHFSQGRLTSEEYEQRVTDAYAAMTKADLRPLFGDLPLPHPVFLAPPAPPVVPFAPPPPIMYAPPVPVPYSYRSKTTAGLLQVVPGVGRLYMGHIGIGLLQILVFFVTFGVGVLWSWIDGLVLLANGGFDAEGRPLRP